MKKFYILTLLAGLCFAFAACKKADTFDPAKQAAQDDADIQAYMKANAINGIKDPSGLYYQIITPGGGATATATSTIQVNYKGQLMNGTVFDQTTTSSRLFVLSSVIQGWQIGVPYVKAGGRILLLIPSGLGYGNTDTGSIPANSVLIFTIDLLSVH
jgi:FKBP-type peptidyl-prolyl cis-trans isomerase FkpA